jgi:capsid protein
VKIALYNNARAVARTEATPVVSVEAPPGEQIRRLFNRIQHWDDSTGPEEVNGAVRAVADLNQKLVRSYEAALTTGLDADWLGTYGSANTEILPSKFSVRARERTLTKDHAHGRAIPQIIADNVVGDDPFELEMTVMRAATAEEKAEFGEDAGVIDKVEDTELNDAIENWWKKFIWQENFTVNGNMSFIEALRIIIIGTVSPGNVICREYQGFGLNGFGYAIDLLEEDRLQETYVGAYNGNPIRGSMEFHAQFPRRVVAYWLLTRHPGEFFSPGLGDSGKNGSRQEFFRERVPADEIILFSNLRERPEQDRGMSNMAAAMPAQWKKEQYARSLTVAAICSCIRAFVIEKKMPTGIEMPPELQTAWRNVMANMSGGGSGGNDPAQTQQGAGQPVKTLKPGQERELPWGYEAKVLAPEFPIAAAHEFIQDLLREIAVGTDVPFQELSGDYQNLGFMAALSCKQPFQRKMRVRQNVFKEDLRRIFKNALRQSITIGWFDRNCTAAVADKILLSRLDEFVEAHEFKAQQFEFINPLVQMQGLIIGNESGHLTDQQVQDALPRGQKIEKHYLQLARERKMKLKLGLPLNEEVTEPQINKEGDAPPGTTKPEADELNDGGAGKTTPVKKVAKPKSRSFRSATMRASGIGATPEVLHEMSNNGEH